MSERIVLERKARSTGTTVQLVDRGPLEEDDGRDEGDDRWETICVEHGGVCSHQTRKLARSFMAAPEEWCEAGDDGGCMALAEQRNAPITPVPGVTFHDVRPGDRVRVSISGRTGTIVKRCAHKRDGWIVKWDEPVFGVTEGRVAWANLEPAA